MAPRPEITPKVRKLPNQRNPEDRGEDAKGSLASDENSSGNWMTAKPMKSSLKPTGPARSRVTFDLEGEDLELLEEARDLTGMKDVRRVVLEALSKLVQDRRKKKFGETDRPRSTKAPGGSGLVSRHIPAAVRRAVVARCGRRCTYLDSNGRRCTETASLEFHHQEPWGKGGRSTESNVTILCRLCRARHNRH